MVACIPDLLSLVIAFMPLPAVRRLPRLRWPDLEGGRWRAGANGSCGRPMCNVTWKAIESSRGVSVRLTIGLQFRFQSLSPSLPHFFCPLSLPRKVYPRTTGEVYLCGIGGSQYMGPNELRRLSPEDIVPDPDRVAAAHRSFSEMSPSVGDQRPGVTQACMRPCLRDALPMMGLVPETDNAYIACGHNCWGILWAPITGLAMAELIADGRSTTVDLYPFRPERFGRPQPRPGARGRQQGSASVGEQW